ncbi:hypothetical protein Aduo_016650 [Ancylostoma duodenale]
MLNTRIIIIITWIIAVTRCFIYHGVVECDFFYEDSRWTFVLTMREDCRFISKYLDFFKDVAIVIMIAAVDITAIVKVRIINKQCRQSGQSGMDAQRRREINFLKQVLVQVFGISLGSL